MKNGIWSRIFLVVVIPFLIIFSFISVFIIYTVYQREFDRAGEEARTLARYNEVSLQSFIDNARLSVRTAAVELEVINPAAPNARTLAEQVIIARLEDRGVVNTWLAFEPDSFDGTDAGHGHEYPGAPSGRFIRSYVRKDGRVLAAPDMDETSINDLKDGYYYAIPKETGKPFIGLNTGQTLWDYGTGEGVMNTFSVSSPVFRGGRVIGCVGEDLLLTPLVLGEELIEGAVSLLLNAQGNVIYSAGARFIGMSVEDLGFSNADEILEAFDEKREIAVKTGRSLVFDGSGSYGFFLPVQLHNYDQLVYVYASIPQSSVISGVFPVALPIFISLIAAVGIFIVLILLISRFISVPIHALTMASDDISLGNLNQEIAVFNSNDEIGILSRSLYRMVEQFRVHINLHEQARELLDLYARLNSAAYKYPDVKEALTMMLRIICRNYGIDNAMMIYLDKGRPRVFASRGDGAFGEGTDFPFHQQVKTLLKGKRYVSLNSYSLKEAGISFAGRRTTFLCVLPVYVDDDLAAYMVLESDEERGPFINDDISLTFIQDIISYVLARRRQAAAEEAVTLDTPATGTFRHDGAADAAAAASAVTLAELQSGAAAVQTTVGLTPLEKQKRGAIFAAAEEMQDEYNLAAAGGDGAAAAPQAADDTVSPLDKARAIPGLDTDRGMGLLAGTADQYVDLLKFSARVFRDSVGRLDKALESEDIHTFAIEAHGAKGALNNIGAVSLGELALGLEMAGKAGDAGKCRADYPAFREQLIAFADNLSALEADTAAKGGGKGSNEALLAALRKALKACGDYDSFKAQELLSPLKDHDYGDAAISERLAVAISMLEDIDYDGAAQSLGGLIKLMEGQ